MRLTWLWASFANIEASSGRPPSNLVAFAEGVQFTGAKRRLHYHPLLCPGSKTEPQTAARANEWSDYWYVDWAQWFPKTNRPPGDFPLFYDRRFSNHDGKGIYVVNVDGLVFWDPGANWLKAFATKHQTYRLKMPE
jgi:hypothetical protein